MAGKQRRELILAGNERFEYARRMTPALARPRACGSAIT